jgi:hypothetical protein
MEQQTQLVSPRHDPGLRLSRVRIRRESLFYQFRPTPGGPPRANTHSASMRGSRRIARPRRMTGIWPAPARA